MSDLLNQLESIDTQLDAMLDAGQVNAYEELTQQREAIVAELDSDDRRGASALKAADQREQAKAVKGSAKEQVQILKENIALVRARRAELDTATKTNPAGQLTAAGAERIQLGDQIAALEEEAATMEARLPFVELDDDTLEETALTVQSEMELARKELADVGDLAGFSGTRILIERRIAKAQSKYQELATEAELRKRGRLANAMVLDRATKNALNARAEAIRAWEAQKKQSETEARAGEPNAYQVANEAAVAIEAIRALPEQPSKAELDPHLGAVRIDFPHEPGTWR